MERKRYQHCVLGHICGMYLLLSWHLKPRDRQRMIPSWLTMPCWRLAQMLRTIYCCDTKRSVNGISACRQHVVLAAHG